ncbi:hypothetical protein HY631_00480 [Candidatus Uhrbacteria bacterium]|nr:hypothetical protein [Candidatus Uhrbacteria bacterium]
MALTLTQARGSFVRGDHSIFDALTTPIDNLDIGARLAMVLQKAGIRYVWQYAELSKDRKLVGMGPALKKEAMEVVLEGLALGTDLSSELAWELQLVTTHKNPQGVATEPTATAPTESLATPCPDPQRSLSDNILQIRAALRQYKATLEEQVKTFSRLFHVLSAGFAVSLTPESPPAVRLFFESVGGNPSCGQIKVHHDGLQAKLVLIQEALLSYKGIDAFDKVVAAIKTLEDP